MPGRTADTEEREEEGSTGVHRTADTEGRQKVIRHSSVEKRGISRDSRQGRRRQVCSTKWMAVGEDTQASFNGLHGGTVAGCVRLSLALWRDKDYM